MRYGDRTSLLDFSLVHRLAHAQIDGVIASRGLGSMPDPTLDSGRVMEVWAQLMAPEAALSTEAQRPLTDWLQLHANLHEAEYLALKLGDAPELSIVDFSNEKQFYDWMFAHAEVHDTLNQATGLL